MMSPGCVTVAVTTGETVSIGAETVAVMSPGCVTVAVTTGETVSIGADGSCCLHLCDGSCYYR